MRNYQRFQGEKVRIGIRPVIDGRRRGVRESLEDQTMNMAKAAAGQGPEMADVKTRQSVQETLERGPMFTEIR